MPPAIYALALAAFSIGTAEFIISGILPPLAADLAVSIPTAGLLVTAYAIGVAIGGPILTIMTARFSPKQVIVTVLIMFALSQVLCALAPDYGLLMLARLLAACGHGVFFGAGNVVVARLVPPERRGAAFSLFIGGITVANLLGLPGGAAIGNAFGWRFAFAAVGILGAIATLVLLRVLPPSRPAEHEQATLPSQLRALRHQQVYLSYLTITIVMIAALAFGTYQVPLLIEITGVDPAIVPLYLLLGGVGAVIGIYGGGRATDWKPMPSLIAVLLLQSVFYATMLFAMHHPILMGVNIFLSGAFGFAFSTPLQARIILAAREAPNLASALISTAFNIGIAGGAFLGAVMLSSGLGYQHLPIVGIVSGVLAAGVAAFSWSLERRQLAPA
jgi:MFS transporter, DHA1 family, inner membrane transport protein